MQANPITPAKTDTRDIRHAGHTGDEPMGENFILTNPEPVPHEPASVGELLRAARESAGFSLGDIANRLRMGIKQIDAIERADYAALPQGIFLRGFIRNYAKVVGIEVDAALATLERTHTDGSAVLATRVVAPTAAAPLKMQSRGDVFATPKARAAIVAGVIVLLAGAIWYWWEYVRPHLADGGRPRPAESVVQTQISQPQPVLQPAVGNVDATAVLPTAATDKVEMESDKATIPNAAVVPPALLSEPPRPVTAPAPASSPVPADAAKTLRRAGDNGLIGFTFSGQSWVEVIDANGRSILSRRYNAGDVDEVSGRGPFSVVVGNASVTRMAYNGREFSLAPHIRANSTVARVNVK